MFKPITQIFMKVIENHKETKSHGSPCDFTINHKETMSHGSPCDFTINHKETLSHGSHVISQLITRKQCHMVHMT